MPRKQSAHRVARVRRSACVRHRRVLATMEKLLIVAGEHERWRGVPVVIIELEESSYASDGRLQAVPDNEG